MSLYSCDGCLESISPGKARIHCQSCSDYDLCANCYVVQQVSGQHTTSHPILLFKTSGYVPSSIPPPPQQQPVAGPYVSAPPNLPPRPITQQQTPYVYTAPRSPLPNFPPSVAPPAVQNRPRQWQTLFNPDTTPSPTFIALTDALFTRLDPSNSGYLRPEVYSSFLDAQGYPLIYNVCKYLQPNPPSKSNITHTT
jgi:Zinc finger, ZZ type